MDFGWDFVEKEAGLNKMRPWDTPRNYSYSREVPTIYLPQTIVEPRRENLAVLSGGKRCHETQMAITADVGCLAISRERQYPPTGGTGQESPRSSWKGSGYCFLRGLKTRRYRVRMALEGYILPG